MNLNDEQFRKEKLCYFKTGSKPFYNKCNNCNGYGSDSSVCLSYICNDNYRRSSTGELAKRIQEYMSKWALEEFPNTKPIKNNPNQLELELKY